MINYSEWVSESVSQLVTRSPIELFWTAKKIQIHNLILFHTNTVFINGQVQNKYKKWIRRESQVWMKMFIKMLWKKYNELQKHRYTQLDLTLYHKVLAPIAIIYIIYIYDAYYACILQHVKTLLTVSEKNIIIGREIGITQFSMSHGLELTAQLNWFIFLIFMTNVKCKRHFWAICHMVCCLCFKSNCCKAQIRKRKSS